MYICLFRIRLPWMQKTVTIHQYLSLSLGKTILLLTENCFHEVSLISNFLFRALGDKSSDVLIRELEAIEHFKRADLDPNCDVEVTCDDTEVYRTADGTCNNLDNPLWGSAGIQHLRLLPNAYRNGKYISQIIGASPQEDLSSGFATRIDSTRSAQLQKLCSGLKFRIKKLEVLYMYYPGSEQQRRWSDSRMRRSDGADAHADLCLCCSHMA